MADDNKLRGFDIMADSLLKPGTGTSSTDDNDDGLKFTDPDDIIKNQATNDDDDKDDNNQDGEPSKDDNTDDNKDTSDVDDTDDSDDNSDDNNTDDDTTDVDDTDDDIVIDDKLEGDITKFFQQKLAEELGWEYDEDQSFDSVEEMVQYMEGLVATASKPQYANEEVGKLDEFIKNGGKLEDYYKSIDTGGIDLDNADLTKESIQRAVVEENLRKRGYSEERIKRSVDRYEDRGVLEDEAEDALELLKEYKEKNKEKLLEDQQKEVTRIQDEQQKFVSNVEKTIEDLTDIAGVKLNKKEKQELTDYIFKPTKNGQTQYQIDYAAEQEKNLVESAFFTKNKDVILEKTKKQASTETLKDMHRKLKASNNKRVKGSGSSDNSKDSTQMLSKLGRQLITQ